MYPVEEAFLALRKGGHIMGEQNRNIIKTYKTVKQIAVDLGYSEDIVERLPID